jgi:chlorite dismutase
MPLAVDLITRKKLFLTKLLFQQAVVQATSSHSDVSKIMAVIGFDLAAETALKIVVSTLEPRKAPADSFQALVQQADNLLNSQGLTSVPDKANVQHVHSLRNDAQHKAKYPNESDVEDCRTYVRDFLQKLLLDVWELSLERMSLTDIVQYQQVKDYLIAAETALNAGEHNEALIKSELGFSTALGLIKAAVVGRMDPYANPNLNYASWDKSHPSTYALLETLRDHIVRATVGLGFSDYMRYQQIINSVIQSMASFGDGKYEVAVTGRTVSVKDAEFVVAYAVNSVIQIESIAGDLAMPFGSTENRRLGQRLTLT